MTEILCVSAVTRRCNEYRNKSQHRKLTREKNILPPSCRESNPGPFDHESDAVITELSPLPNNTDNDIGVSAVGEGRIETETGRQREK